MTPTCPHCQRPIQSRAAKLCAFCGKAVDVSDAAAAKAEEEKRQAVVQQQRAPVVIEPDADVIEIVARRGKLDEADKIYDDQEAAAIAWGEAMTAYYSLAKALAAAECDCTARRRAGFVLRCRWKTSDVVQRKFNWLTLFTLPAGIVTWKERRAAIGFETFHAQCDTCAQRARAARRRWVLSCWAAVLLAISAIVVFARMQLEAIPSSFAAALAGALFLGFVVATVLAYRGKLTTGPGVHASGRCVVQGFGIVPKE